MLSDAVEVTYHQTVLKQIELRQVSAMVSAHKQLMNVLEILGIATAGEPGDGDLFDDLMGPDPEPPRNNVVKTTRKRATKKKRASARKKPTSGKKKKKVAKKKSRRRRTIDDDVDALMGD